jgi:chromosome segregation ATPase
MNTAISPDSQLRTEPDHKRTQEWAETKITDINTSALTELASLDALRSEQQEVYKEQLSEKNEVWVKLVDQRREEAAQLRSMIFGLSVAISGARLQAKDEIESARRNAFAGTKRLRAQSQKLAEQITVLEQTINAERRQYEHSLGLFEEQCLSVEDGKKSHKEKLKIILASLQEKLREKQAKNEEKLAEQVSTIEKLREQLQGLREAENEKQRELMSMRKACASMSQKISVRKDEAGSLKRQYRMLKRDNEELEGEIRKVESGIAGSLNVRV